MRKSTKLLIGIATLWPLLYMVLFFGFMFYMIFPLWNGAEPDEKLFFIIFPIHMLTMIVVVALEVFYIVNVFRNDRVNKDMKVLWAIVLFMGNMIAMPIYWFLYIWREPKALAPVTTG